MKQFKNVKEIQIERLNNRDNKLIYNLLGVLLGEIDRLPTRAEPTEDSIYSVINKMYNNAKEMAQYSSQSEQEMNYLKDFIRQQLTEEELKNIIEDLRASGYTSVGQFMKHLNTHYKGRFDGKKAMNFIQK